MTKKTLSGICSALVALAVGVGVCCAGYASRNDAGKWFKNGDISKWHWADNSGDNQGDEINTGELVKEIESNGIRLKLARIAPDDYAEYGIDTQANTAYSIHATVNENAADKSIIGAVNWKNASSSWATGKSINDYVTVNQTTEYGLDFTLTIKQAFGEPVIFKAASMLDSGVNATAEVNYLKEMLSFTATLNPSLGNAAGKVYVGDTNNTVQITPNYGVGTVTGTVSGYKTTLTTNNYTRTELKARLNASNQGTNSFTVVSEIIATGKDFKIPLLSGGLLGAGGNDTAARIIVTNFIVQRGCTDSSGSAATTAGVSSFKYEITYSYGSDYSKALSYTDNSGRGFRNDNLTAIQTITNIDLDKTNIVVYPN